MLFGITSKDGNRLISINAVVIACAIGAAGSAAVAVDLSVFLTTTSTANLSNSLQPGKLRLLLGLYAALAASMTVISIKVVNENSSHRRTVSSWSAVSVTLWFLLSVYLMLVYYPLPSHPHHLDKLLFIIGGLLAWTLWMAGYPAGVAQVLNGRLYGGIRLVLINLLLFAVLGEAAVRLMDPILARDGLYNREHSSQWLKPHIKTDGSIGRTNSFGFRDREWTVDKPPSTIRVLALGDSFTWATGVSYDEGMVTLLGQALRNKFSQSEIINLGVPGFEPEHELDLLQQLGIHLHPDLVMLNFFVGNDIMRKRGVGRESAVVVAGNIFYAHLSGNWVHDHWGPDRWFVYHSLNYLIQVDLSPVRRWFRKQKSPTPAVSQDSAAVPAGSSTPKHWSVDYLAYLEERSDIFAKIDSEEWNFHWPFTRSTLDTLYNVLQARRIPLIVVLIPERVQLDGNLQKEFLTTIGASTDDYDFLKPQNMLGQWCRIRGAVCVDLLAAWTNGPSRSSLYFENDAHWNQAGHARAASDVLPILYREILPGMSNKEDRRYQVSRTTDVVR